MTRVFTPLGFAGFLTMLAHGLSVPRHEGLKRAALIVEKEAKRVIGTYDYGWPQLAASTQEDRVHKGFTANDPLLRTGEMRDSIAHTVLEREAHVGSDEEKAVWQELGTDRIPARSFLAGAAMRKGPEVAAAIGRVMHGYLSHGGVIEREF